ncbi:MAG: 50S ribosomal protein L22 [Desulfarculaceae bacterium]|nr:50S ribosomal protein L22 [Desulfarculaceae bacterium]MCF8048105.1 50S ribosomal protein L22 [Desulfarculaceae bacterium]MCF8064099.1 50S ribosomal protein L22 [Desulfarculaceae bacterium]MCF8099991.1 50S ribosomal protein L22 [Desulfarculaceae bacterium]MCF8122573.1 50S ribosomal protein L22 [Desulfarculaceae bacterium]
MEAVAKAKFVRISPRKARLVADAVRGMKVGEALDKLKFTPKKAAGLFVKVISSAVANATNDSNVDADNLYIKKAFVDGGPTLKRWRPRAMGRAYIIRKRTSHITVVLDER